MIIFTRDEKKQNPQSQETKDCENVAIYSLFPINLFQMKAKYGSDITTALN